MPIYLQCDEIRGSVRAEGFHDCIELETAQFSSNKNGTDIESSAHAAVIDDFIVTSYVDASGVSILKSALGVLHHELMKIHLLRTGAEGKSEHFMSYELKDCYIKQYSMSASRRGVPLETICLSFYKMTFKYWNFDAKGKRSAQEVFVHDQNLLNKN